MKKIYFLLIVLCLCMSSCKDNNAPTASDMTGVWRVYYTATPTWYRFAADNTVERFSYVAGEKVYYYCRGTFRTSNNRLTVNLEKERIYVPEGVLRCVAEFNELEAAWKDETYQITSFGKDEMEATYNDAKVQFARLEALPSLWVDECSEPELVATKQNLAAKWDLRSFYKLEGNQYQAWFFNTPETQGMTLLESGEFSDAQFWVNCIYVVELNAHRVTADEGINIRHRDCAWAVKDDVLAMTCVTYTKITYDNNGNEIAHTAVTPAYPIVVQFKIHNYTQNWLTLYFSEDERYYSFHRSDSGSQSVAARSSRSCPQECEYRENVAAVEWKPACE